MDISYILQKLNEIDKLKMIILDRDQRQLLEYWPREVIYQSDFQGKKHYSMNNLTKDIPIQKLIQDEFKDKYSLLSQKYDKTLQFELSKQSFHHIQKRINEKLKNDRKDNLLKILQIGQGEDFDALIDMKNWDITEKIDIKLCRALDQKSIFYFGCMEKFQIIEKSNQLEIKYLTQPQSQQQISEFIRLTKKQSNLEKVQQDQEQLDSQNNEQNTPTIKIEKNNTIQDEPLYKIKFDKNSARQNIKQLKENIMNQSKKNRKNTIIINNETALIQQICDKIVQQSNQKQSIQNILPQTNAKSSEKKSEVPDSLPHIQEPYNFDHQIEFGKQLPFQIQNIKKKSDQPPNILNKKIKKSKHKNLTEIISEYSQEYSKTNSNGTNFIKYPSYDESKKQSIVKNLEEKYQSRNMMIFIDKRDQKSQQRCSSFLKNTNLLQKFDSDIHIPDENGLKTIRQRNTNVFGKSINNNVLEYIRNDVVEQQKSNQFIQKNDEQENSSLGTARNNLEYNTINNEVRLYSEK